MAKLKSYNRLSLEGGVITSWIKRTPKEPFHVYFEKDFGGTTKAGLLSFGTMGEMVHAQSAITKNWDRLTLSNFPEQAVVNLKQYRQWKVSKRRKSQKPKEHKSFFNDLLGLSNSQSSNSQSSNSQNSQNSRVKSERRTLTEKEVSALIDKKLGMLIL